MIAISMSLDTRCVRNICLQVACKKPKCCSSATVTQIHLHKAHILHRLNTNEPWGVTTSAVAKVCFFVTCWKKYGGCNPLTCPESPAKAVDCLCWDQGILLNRDSKSGPSQEVWPGSIPHRAHVALHIAHIILTTHVAWPNSQLIFQNKPLQIMKMIQHPGKPGDTALSKASIRNSKFVIVQTSSVPDINFSTYDTYAQQIFC